MSDYIRREDVKKRAIAIPLGGKFVEVVPVGEIEDIPQADVMEVVHGHWIDYPEDRWIYAQCSVCESVRDVKSNYCPVCGAKMDGSK